MKPKTIVLLILFFFHFIESEARCIPFKKDVAYFNSRDVIFIGEVLNIKKGVFWTTVKFEIKKIYKGSKTEKITIKSRNNSLSLEGFVEKGETWLLTAMRKNKRYVSTHCNLLSSSLTEEFSKDTSFLNGLYFKIEKEAKINTLEGTGGYNYLKPVGYWNYKTNYLSEMNVTINGNYKKGERTGLWTIIREDSLYHYEYYKNGRYKWMCSNVPNNFFYLNLNYPTSTYVLRNKYKLYIEKGKFFIIYRKKCFGIIKKAEKYSWKSNLIREGYFGLFGILNNELHKYY